MDAAAVLGADDGIISTASLIVGVASAAATQSDVLIAGVAGLVAGAMSMAARRVCIRQFAIRHRTAELAGSGVAYVPFFPLAGFTRLQSSTLSEVATQLGTTQMQTALAWLLHRAPNILLIPGTSSIGHLRENLATAELVLPDEVLARLNAINRKKRHSGRGPGCFKTQAPNCSVEFFSRSKMGAGRSVQSRAQSRLERLVKLPSITALVR